eukprot:2855428-Pleurochrysis_carterae.AAC.5
MLPHALQFRQLQVFTSERCQIVTARPMQVRPSARHFPRQALARRLDDDASLARPRLRGRVHAGRAGAQARAAQLHESHRGQHCRAAIGGLRHSSRDAEKAGPPDRLRCTVPHRGVTTLAPSLLSMAIELCHSA